MTRILRKMFSEYRDGSHCSSGLGAILEILDV